MTLAHVWPPDLVCVRRGSFCFAKKKLRRGRSWDSDQRDGRLSLFRLRLLILLLTQWNNRASTGTVPVEVGRFLDWPVSSLKGRLRGQLVVAIGVPQLVRVHCGRDAIAVVVPMSSVNDQQDSTSMRSRSIVSLGACSELCLDVMERGRSKLVC